MNTNMNTTMDADFTKQLLFTLQTADTDYIAKVLFALDRGMPLFKVNKDAEKPVKAKKAVAEKKKAVAGKPVPEAVDGAPTAASYRLASAEIDEDKCVGRILKGGEDKRWKPVIYRESQCGKDVAEDGLCKTCAARSEKYEGKAGAWNGRVTEEPLEVVHMLGTEWAEKKKPQFIGSSSPSSPSEPEASEASVAEPSENESAQEMTEVKKVKAKPKLTDEEKEAAKAAKAAEKEAEKAAKAAEKAKPKPKPKAEKAEKSEKSKPKPKPKAEAKVVETPVVEVTGEVRLIDDKAYFLRNGNVFHYCELDEEIGAFVGRINDDGSIDTEADELKAPESETE